MNGKARFANGRHSNTVGTAVKAIKRKDLAGQAQHPERVQAGAEALSAIRVRGKLGSRWEEWRRRL